MKSHTLPLLLIAAAGLLGRPAPAVAQQTRVLTADKHNEYGLVYNLPLTSLRFEVTARRTATHRGPFYQYAERFIGTDKVVTADTEKWEIVSVKAVAYGTADTSEKYLMQLKPGAVMSVCVADDGMLLAINTETKAPELPAVTPDQPAKPGVSTNDYLEYVNEDFLASQSSAMQARMLSESLMEVRDAKVSLTRGTAETMPTDGRQLELMLGSLAHQEAAMTAAFTGTTETETVTRTFTYTPDEEGRSVLFRLSDFAGFVGADDYSGEPVYVTMQTLETPELPVDAKGETKKLPKDAVIYNIPGTARITLTMKGATLWSENVDCAQLGVTFGLAPTLFSDRKARSAAIFNPVTGGIESIFDLAE